MSQSIEERFSRLGVGIPSIALPKNDVDLYRWAVIACDQHTSEPDYWEEVDSVVGESPSTLRMILPEVYLDDDPRARETAAIETMHRYISQGVLRELEPGIVLSVRSTPHVSSRQGLMLALDLEQYDFRPGANRIIRSTEKTIVERLPARVRIRQEAPVEIPHVLVLIDDPDDLVFGSIAETDPPQIYNTELMLGGGSVTGYHIAGADLGIAADALEELWDRAKGKNPFLFAVGDGNHSLAAAKEVWESMKSDVPEDHPARYALVEVVNLFDPGLRFEPIHRLVTTENREDWLDAMTNSVQGTRAEAPLDEVRTALRKNKGVVGYVAGSRSGVITLGSKELPVGLIQEYLNGQQDVGVDYIHGWDTSVQLGGKRDSIVLLMPAFDQAQLFPTVAKRGVLPRKAFSLGEAEEKRYYLECRRISL